MLPAAPLVLGIGILNPVFDHQVFAVGGLTLSMGWITFISVCLKCLLTVFAALLLIATTGMNNLAAALRMLRIPKLFVLQLLLTYRYISVLLEEVSLIWRAYSLRAPGQKGINWKVWGPLIGQLILRTFDRAQRVYQAMCLRGFTGEYNTGSQKRLTLWDLAIWPAGAYFHPGENLQHSRINRFIIDRSDLMSHHMTEVKDIHYVYPDGHKAINGISFRIHHGESVGIIGANRAGKSTLLMLLMGVLLPSQGEVRVGDILVTKETLPFIRQRMGMVFQNPDDQLFMTTVYDDVAFGPRNYKLAENEVEKRVQKALEMVGILHLKDRAPFKLSGGENALRPLLPSCPCSRIFC